MNKNLTVFSMKSESNIERFSAKLKKIFDLTDDLKNTLKITLNI